MTKILEGKVALVTGGSAGIGEATALAFAREGAEVVVADVDVANGEATAHAIVADGGEAIFVKADVSQNDDVAAMVQTTIDTCGRLDCAFNNAGIEGQLNIPITEYDEAIWDRVIAINLKGVWLCLKHEVRQMQAQGGGAIVNMASVAGLIGGSLGSAYFASKHGVVGLTKAVAIENGKKNIRVNAVCPGVIETRMGDLVKQGDPRVEKIMRANHPIGRFGQPNEVAEAVVWLCSDAASFVTGHAMPIDGGFVAK